MTRRERLERKLDLRTEWAEKADARADARFATAHRIVDSIPLGQPILVGHHSEKRHRREIDRMGSNMSKGVEESKLAEHHRSAARGLESALDRSIFSDDENAIEALEARIDNLERERARMVAINAAWRKAGKPRPVAADAIRDAWQRIADAVGMSDNDLGPARKRMAQHWNAGAAPFPTYSLSNLGGRITADRKRIAAIRQRAARTAAAEESGGIVVQGEGEYCRVTFAEKPERAIIDALKAAGFWWGSGSWCGLRAKLPVHELRGWFGPTGEPEVEPEDPAAIPQE